MCKQNHFSRTTNNYYYYRVHNLYVVVVYTFIYNILYTHNCYTILHYFLGISLQWVLANFTCVVFISMACLFVQQQYDVTMCCMFIIIYYDNIWTYKYMSIHHTHTHLIFSRLKSNE